MFSIKNNDRKEEINKNRSYNLSEMNAFDDVF